MPRPLIAYAVSVVLHGAGAVGLVTAGRPDSLTLPLVVDFVVPEVAGRAEPRAATATPPPAAPRGAVVALPRGRPASYQLRSAMTAPASVTPTKVDATPPSNPVPSVGPAVVMIPPLSPAPPADGIVRWELTGATPQALAATATAPPTDGGAVNGADSGGPPTSSGTVNTALAGILGDVGPAPVGGGSDPVSLAVPRYQDNARPVYPWQARLRGEQGMVLLSVLIDRRGQVSDLRVERSSGSRALDDAATGAVRRWTFRPGRRGTEPVESWVQVPVRFRLED